METTPSDAQFPTPNEFSTTCHLLRDKKERIAYCRDLITKIPSERNVASAAHILCAHVYLELACTLFQPTKPESVDSLYQQAMHRATLSGDDYTQYVALFSYGRYLCSDCSDRGTSWMQKALKYAHTSVEIVSLMTYLAMVWADYESTYSQALVLYDWVCLIEDAPLNTMCQKYRCLIRHGFKNDVQAVASGALGETCDEIGTVLAARLALNRKKAAHKAAEKGFVIAEETANQSWRGQFKLALSRSDPSIKFDISPASPG
jgi:hypothetical protein